MPQEFHWQDGYSAFYVSFSHRRAVIDYIAKQQIHHKQNSFADEYIKILKKNGIEPNNENLFEFFN